MNQFWICDYLTENLDGDVILNYIIPWILEQINDKKHEITNLEEDVISMNKVIKKVWINPECDICKETAWIIENVQILVKVLLEQVKKNEAKISLLWKQIQLLNKKTQEYKNQAYKDWLTWLYNRFFAEKVMAANIDRINSWINFDFCVWLLDLNLFKNINDLYWHAAWDFVLKNFANFMLWELKKLEKPIDNWKRKNWRRNMIFRFWWEEFLVLSSLSKNKFKSFLDLCLLNYSKIEHNYEWITINSTFSAWISEYKLWIEWNDSIFELIKSADKALYKAKDNWRKNVVIYNE